VAVAAVAALGLVLTGCATDTGDSSASAPTTQVLTLASDITPWFDHDQIPSGGAGNQIWSAVYDTLLTTDADGEVVPNAAESFEINADNTMITLTLREGMSFTDGTAVDGDAVKANLDDFISGTHAEAGKLAGATVELIDERTVSVTVPQPTAGLAEYLTGAPGALVSPKTMNASTAATDPIGSGPYVLDQGDTTTGSRYSFTRNEDYWNADAFPYDSVVFKILADPTARNNALKSGQVDGGNVLLANAADVESAGVTLLEAYVTFAGLVIGDRDGQQVPALGDVRVRQAINMVFDREGIATGLYGGLAAPTTQVFSVDTPAYEATSDDRYEYDLAAAKKLMADAGYADGFQVTVPNVAGVTDLGNPLVVQQLGLLGITVTLESEDAQKAFPDLAQGRWPMAYMSIETGSNVKTVTDLVSASGWLNFKHTSDSELDSLIATFQSAQGEAQAEASREINDWLIDNAWFAPWVTTTSFYGLGEDVTALIAPGALLPRLASFAPAS